MKTIKKTTNDYRIKEDNDPNYPFFIEKKVIFEKTKGVLWWKKVTISNEWERIYGSQIHEPDSCFYGHTPSKFSTLKETENEIKRLMKPTIIHETLQESRKRKLDNLNSI